MTKSRMLLAAAAALLMSTAANALVYTGSFSANAFAFIGAGSMTATYTITTDGTLGALSAVNYTGYTLSIDYNGTIRDSSGTGVLGPYGNGATATATQLLFDFTAGSSNSLIFFDNNDALCFMAGTLACVGEPTPSSSIISFPLSAYGYKSRSGVEVIATTGVPEPASWAMLIAGFGLTGAAMRRRQRATA